MSPGILVAADGTRGGMDALRLARRLAEREGARVEVLAIHDPSNLRLEGAATTPGAAAGSGGTEAVRALRSRIRAQLRDVGGGAEDWPLTVEVGRVARGIASWATQHEVGRILIGLNDADPAERWLGRESLLELIRLVDVPVLGVPAGASNLPRCVIVAVDFSKYSLEIAREALEDLEPGAQLHLVKVTPPGTALAGTERLSVERQLTELACELEIPGIAAVETHLLSGDPAEEILRLAGRVGAELIAAGSHGASYPGQLLPGDVYGKLVHQAECALLIGPPRGMRPRAKAPLEGYEVPQTVVA